jgi:hypothetical protein
MKPKSKDTVLALANAIGLAAGIVQEVSDKDVVETVNGQKATRSALTELVASRLQARFAKYTSRKVN